jgi:phosphatidylserine/phosphatidylglycerophosphate/cardiolipin synthase-like enzyme
MAKFASGLIECFVGSREKGAADDLEEVIVRFIQRARKTLWIAVQELDSEPIARAIVDAKRRRGVDVELFLEQDYLQTDFSDKRDAWLKKLPGEGVADYVERVVWAPDEGHSLAPNRRILSAILRAGIPVHSDFNPKIFHQKFIVRDVRGGEGTDPALLTGSCNFTDTDCHKNLNHIVVFHDQSIAQEYQVEFGQLREGEFGRGRQGEVPRTYFLDGVPVKVLFAPDHAPELEIIKQMLKIRDTTGGLHGQLDFAIYTFSGSSGIDDAMLMLARAGCQLRGVLDKTQGFADWSAARGLQHPNIQLMVPRADWELRKVHHKLMTVDDAIVVAGSFNYTAPANDYNDENIFVIGSPQDVLDKKPVNRDECRKIVGFFRTELERIFSHCEPLVVPAGPP